MSINGQSLDAEIWITCYCYALPISAHKKDELGKKFQTLKLQFFVREDYHSEHNLWGSRLILTNGKELLKVLTEVNYYFWEPVLRRIHQQIQIKYQIS